MKKVFFVLMIEVLCTLPGLAQTPRQDLNPSGFSAETPLNSAFLPAGRPAAPAHLTPPPALTSALTGMPGAALTGPETEPLPLPPASAKSAQAPAKQNRSLKGLTTGDKLIDAYILASAKRHDLDPVLLYSVMHQESAFRRNVVSSKGARGLMQLTPATAARFGVRNAFNPRQNIEAGAKYLRFLLDTFHGDLSLALAAYNSGEGTVKRYGGQVPPYRETVKYVSQIRQRYDSVSDEAEVK